PSVGPRGNRPGTDRPAVKSTVLPVMPSSALTQLCPVPDYAEVDRGPAFLVLSVGRSAPHNPSYLTGDRNRHRCALKPIRRGRVRSWSSGILASGPSSRDRRSAGRPRVPRETTRRRGPILRTDFKDETGRIARISAFRGIRQQGLSIIRNWA